MTFSVLVIDDYAPMRRQIEFALSGLYGIEVHLANDGAAGLQRIRELKPSLVILDLELPDMGGMDVLRECKSDPLTSDIPVVVLTASETYEDQIPSVLLAGATDYLRKPIDSVDLRQYISARVALAEQARAERTTQRRLKHDVNNPLTAIICLADLLKDPATASDSEKVTTYADEISLAAQRIYDITRQILSQGNAEVPPDA